MNCLQSNSMKRLANSPKSKALDEKLLKPDETDVQTPQKQREAPKKECVTPPKERALRAVPTPLKAMAGLFKNTHAASSSTEDCMESGVKTRTEDCMESGVKNSSDEQILASKGTESYQWYVFILYGSALMMPYNAMLGSVDYFGAKFGVDFQFVNAICLTTPNFLTLFITAFVWKPNNYWGAVCGYSGLCAMCCLVPFLENRTSVLAAVIVLAFFNSIAQAAMNGLGSQSPELLPALQTGVGLAGVLSSALRILTKAALGVQFGTRLYFMMAASMCVAALVPLKFLPQQQTPPVAAVSASCGLLRKLWMLLAVFFTNFTITLSFFPGLLATIPAQDLGRVLVNGWWSVLLVAGFNMFDFLGKYFANLPAAQFHSHAGARKLLLLQIFRAGLVFVLAYATHKDTAVWVLVAILAFTNGWFGTAGFSIQHQMLDPELRDQAAVVSTFFILFGISTGSFLGSMLFN